MPSFDIVSKVEKHELMNAVDQANRELATRFDFKGVDAKYELKDDNVTLTAPSDFQVKQMQEILQSKLVKRGIDVKSLKFGDMDTNLAQAKWVAAVQDGISADNARKIMKLIKASKIKVQSAIQDEQVRVTGKKRDELQQVMAMLKEEDLDQSLQYTNFRD